MQLLSPFLSATTFAKSYVSFVASNRYRPSTAFVKASVMVAQRKSEEAIDVLSARLSSESSQEMRSREISLLVEMCAECGRINEAIGFAEELVQLDFGNEESHKVLLTLLTRVGNDTRAADAAAEALQTFPGHAGFTLAFIMHSCAVFHDPRSLEKCNRLIRAIEVKTLSDGLTKQVAQCRLLMAQAEAQEAYQRLEHFIDNPRVPLEGVLCYATCLLRQGRALEARIAIRELLAEQSNDIRLLELGVESYLADGPCRQPEFALQMAERAAIESHWLNPCVLHLLGRAYNANQDPLAALAAAERAREVGVAQRGSFFYHSTLDLFIKHLKASTLISTGS